MNDNSVISENQFKDRSGLLLSRGSIIDPTRFEPDSKINESDMGLIFFIWIGSGRVQINPTLSD
jgi:hypothetical protein